MDKDLEQLLTVADIAGHIGAHEQTVRLWIKRGELKASKHGNRTDYDAFLARRTFASAIGRQLLETIAHPLA